MAKISVGKRLSFQNSPCTVRYIGPIKGKEGEWLGLEWDDPSRGKHSGEHEGVQYFQCRIPKSGSFVRSNRPHDECLSFLKALKDKYVANLAEGAAAAPIEFGTKIAEEVGFEKASKKFSNLPALKFVILDSMAIDRALDDGDNISDTVPSVKELDLSRNLFTSLEAVAAICSQLHKLTNLRINGNRFSSLHLSPEAKDSFVHIKDLEAESQLLSLDEIEVMLQHFTSLTSLSLSINSVSGFSLPSGSGLFDRLPLAENLQVLSLEENNLSSLSTLNNLQGLKKLARLILTRNQIESAGSEEEVSSIRLPSLTFLDVSYNRINSWMFLNALPLVFPNLQALRISHNPLYEDAVNGENGNTNKAESKFMLTIGRLSSKVKTLNFSTITPAQRLDAELYYMSEIAKEIENSPPSEEQEILKKHPRWEELQDLHGIRNINRGAQSKPERITLASKLIDVTFTFSDKKMSRRIPRTITISALRSLVGKMFGLRPTNVVLQLVEDQDGAISGDALFLDDFRDLGFYVEGRVAGIQVSET